MDNELAWMLAGRAPFVERTPTMQMAAIAGSTAPRLSSVMPDAPRALDRLVAACLSRDVKQRPANGRAVCEALAAVK